MSDLISRKAVLDFPIRLDHYDEEHGNRDFVLGIESVMNYVESLPSESNADQRAQRVGSVDTISRQAAIDAAIDAVDEWDGGCNKERERFIRDALDKLSSAQLERLSDDDFEAIRIHLNAQKERLCNQQRWKEADEYQRIIDRFIAFASAGPNPNTGAWVGIDDFPHQEWECNQCGKIVYTDSETGIEEYEFCPHCGAEMLNAEGDGGAEWVETSGGEHYKCSRCGFLAPYYLSVDREPCEWLSDFCPNCGKLMWRGSE